MSWYLIAVLFLVGLWGMVAKANMIKKVMGLSIANSAIVLFFVYHGSLVGTTAPIMSAGVQDVVDPLPQALMLTAIVVGICVLALAVALVYRLYQRFHTLDMREVERALSAEEE